MMDINSEEAFLKLIFSKIANEDFEECTEIIIKLFSEKGIDQKYIRQIESIGQQIKRAGDELRWEEMRIQEYWFSLSANLNKLLNLVDIFLLNIKTFGPHTDLLTPLGSKHSPLIAKLLEGNEKYKIVTSFREEVPESLTISIPFDSLEDNVSLEMIADAYLFLVKHSDKGLESSFIKKSDDTF